MLDEDGVDPALTLALARKNWCLNTVGISMRVSQRSEENKKKSRGAGTRSPYFFFFFLSILSSIVAQKEIPLFLAVTSTSSENGFAFYRLLSSYSIQTLLLVACGMRD